MHYHPEDNANFKQREITIMTTTTNPGVAPNGRQRRSLNDSITKLDQILDGLSEAIPETIRDTLRESVGAAVAEGVRSALLEIFASEEVQAMLRGATTAAPPTAVPPTSPSLTSRVLTRTREVLATGAR